MGVSRPAELPNYQIKVQDSKSLVFICGSDIPTIHRKGTKESIIEWYNKKTPLRCLFHPRPWSDRQVVTGKPRGFSKTYQCQKKPHWAELRSICFPETLPTTPHNPCQNPAPFCHLIRPLTKFYQDPKGQHFRNKACWNKCKCLIYMSSAVFQKSKCVAWKTSRLTELL